MHSTEYHSIPCLSTKNKTEDVLSLHPLPACQLSITNGPPLFRLRCGRVRIGGVALLLLRMERAVPARESGPFGFFIVFIFGQGFHPLGRSMPALLVKYTFQRLIFT